MFSRVHDDTVDFVDAPPKLIAISDAYAVYIVGDSMVPRFESGEVAYVNPNVQPHRDDYVVVQTSKDGGDTIQGWVKRFISMDDRTLKVSQLNPSKILTFQRKNVIAVHRIVFSGPG
jgi:phage repressor protein C with HTH and peptisase S24 domain